MTAETMDRLREAARQYEFERAEVIASMRTRDQLALVAHREGASVSQIAAAVGVTKAGAQGILTRATRAASSALHSRSKLSRRSRDLQAEIGAESPSGSAPVSQRRATTSGTP